MNTYLAIGLSFGLSFLIAALLGLVLIPWLRKLKFGQTILDIGPAWHKSKQGLPTMGGMMFIASTVLALAVVLITDKLLGGNIAAGDSLVPEQMYIKIFSGLLLALGFGAIGFVDDYIKVVKKRNLGLTPMQKTIPQVLLCVAYLASLYMGGASAMYIPFVGMVDLGVFFWIFGIVIIYATINAVNFTDGIDGLCGSVTAITALAFTVGAILRGVFGISVLAAALAGGCIGYLIWNWHPAKVMMGDMGSMFLGGMVAALAYALDCPLILLPMGIIYVIEGMSDVLQIGYFKATGGKRIFKMAPIHHHFEMCGWKETKIVGVFSFVNLLGCAAGVAILYFGLPH